MPKQFTNCNKNQRMFLRPLCSSIRCSYNRFSRVKSIYFVAPTSGCDIISEANRCISHFTILSSWQTARDKCLAWGGDLATVTSLEEYNLMYSLNTAYANCWIGLNDLETEGTWVWVDGSNSTYRHWAPGQPEGPAVNQDCGCLWSSRKIEDCVCSETYYCYFCSIIGELNNNEPFGLGRFATDHSPTKAASRPLFARVRRYAPPMDPLNII